jgi:hypothetical protein
MLETKQMSLISNSYIGLTSLTKVLVLCLTSAVATVVYATEYHVGPGKPLTSLDEVPWLSLQAGDSVNIYWRNEPYRTKVGIRSQGTELNPIVVRGVKGSNGELPIISGQNATTPANMGNFFNAVYDENLAVFLVKRGPQDTYGYKPKYITFENLKIVGAYSGYSFTDTSGAVRQWAAGAAAIWVVPGENITIRNCEITDNGNGLFVLSKNDEPNVSRNILIESNHVYGNGTPLSYRQHNIYTQASNITFQFNHLGRLRSGAEGSVLKDRSSGTTIRYNWIETAARVLDLVDPEDSYSILTKEPAFRDTYVYGNIIVNDLKDKTSAASRNMIHYGGDSGVTDVYRKGTLHFYNNTVYIDADLSDAWYLRIFDLSTNEEAVDLKNNILYRKGTSNLFLMNLHGIANFTAPNWISIGWQNGVAGFDGAVNVAPNSIISGETHCFVDPMNLNLSLRNDSVCLNTGTPDLGIPIDRMYLAPLSFRPRHIIGGGMDLGAFEYGNPPLPPTLSIE